MTRTGIILPTFRAHPDDALQAARVALAAGVDGVFCYDHIWPMGQPERPALAPFPILAALAAAPDIPATAGGGPFFGTLVARVGLVPNEVLVGQFSALEHLAPGRVVAALGTGDHLSKEENLAYGVPFGSVARRRSDLVAVASTLRDQGLTVWVAGGPGGRTTEAREAGVSVNLWGADPGLVAGIVQAQEVPEVTWAGPAPESDRQLREIVAGVADAGASWVVFGWGTDPSVLVAAAHDATAGAHT